MEFVCIEAKAFMEMNEALEAVEKKMRETCGGGICSMDDWIDNQEACMLMNRLAPKAVATSEKQDYPLQPYRPQGILQASGYYTLFGKQYSPCNPRILMT